MSETIKTREQLKQTFVTGAVPTQQDYADVFDAMVHSDDIASIMPSPDQITPFEQYILAAFTKAPNGIGPDISRPPVMIAGTLSLDNSTDPADVILQRGIIFHRGLFYDTAKQGTRLDIYVKCNANVGDFVRITVDTLSYDINIISSPEGFSMNGVEADHNYYQYSLGSDVIAECHREYDSTSGQMGYFFHIFSNYDGQHSVQTDRFDSNYTHLETLTAYNDYSCYVMASAADYGSDSEDDGWHFGCAEIQGARLFIHLTGDMHLQTGRIGYLAAHCYYTASPATDLPYVSDGLYELDTNSYVLTPIERYSIQ